MAYAIMQTSLDAPPVEGLLRAFRALPTLTDADAAFLARNAFGVLLENLSEADARALQQALEAEGIITETVDQRDIPALPPPNRLKRADCLSHVLVVYDAVGRPTEVNWSRVIVVAAGLVSLAEFRRIEQQRTVYTAGPRGQMHGFEITDVSTREEQSHRSVLEILLDEPSIRYHVEAEDFLYTYLGARLRKDRTANYVSVVRDVLQYAPMATVNRGAASLWEDPDRTFLYPSKSAFEKETRWLLWCRPAHAQSEGL